MQNSYYHSQIQIKFQMIHDDPQISTTKIKILKTQKLELKM